MLYSWGCEALWVSFISQNVQLPRTCCRVSLCYYIQGLLVTCSHGTMKCKATSITRLRNMKRLDFLLRDELTLSHRQLCYNPALSSNHSLSFPFLPDATLDSLQTRFTRPHHHQAVIHPQPGKTALHLHALAFPGPSPHYFCSVKLFKEGYRHGNKQVENQREHDAPASTQAK